MNAMLTSRQIRAARGLLGWSGDELADKVDVTRATLSKIESDLVQPQERTVARISEVLDKHGVEFLEGDGVRMRQQEVRVFSGKTGYRQFLDHIYITLKNGGRIRQFNMSDSRTVTFDEDYVEAHLVRMGQIDDLDAKVLTHEGDTDFMADYCTYRWMSKEDADLAPFYLYGDYFMLPMYESSHKRDWISIKSKLLVDIYSRQFDKFWAKASVPKKKLKGTK
jgi:transcriptional regulator with XRE-family HTH domain